MAPVAAYHVIITAYGFWLPNDPRGSWSDFVRAWELRRFGPATKVTTRRSVAGVKHDHRERLAAKEFLARPPVIFDGLQCRAIGTGFDEWVRKSQATVYACAILPEHVHLVIARHAYEIEQVANLLKGEATKRLSKERRHPFASSPYRNGTLPSPWARKFWKRYLFTADDILRAIRYVEENPLKEGKPRQRWTFVSPYLGGLLL